MIIAVIIPAIAPLDNTFLFSIIGSFIVSVAFGLIRNVVSAKWNSDFVKSIFVSKVQSVISSTVFSVIPSCPN